MEKPKNAKCTEPQPKKKKVWQTPTFEILDSEEIRSGSMYKANFEGVSTVNHLFLYSS